MMNKKGVGFDWETVAVIVLIAIVVGGSLYFYFKGKTAAEETYNPTLAYAKKQTCQLPIGLSKKIDLDMDGFNDYSPECEKCLGVANECEEDNAGCNEQMDYDKDGIPDACDFFPTEKRKDLTCGYWDGETKKLGYQAFYLGEPQQQCCTKKLADLLANQQPPNQIMPGYKCVRVTDSADQKEKGWVKNAPEEAKAG